VVQYCWKTLILYQLRYCLQAILFTVCYQVRIPPALALSLSLTLCGLSTLSCTFGMPLMHGLASVVEFAEKP